MSHVFVGMSGGVDSSVSALLLQQQGYQVSGINLRLFHPNSSCEQSCGTQSDTEDARLIADKLGFSLHVADFSEKFLGTVIQNFVSEYEAGRTPNPCVVCNRTIKFGAMLEEVRALGGDYLATGHYARIGFDSASGRYLLKRGADRSKDQSYFLYMLTQEQLAHTLFPLGELTKTAVRQLAEEHALITARKRDSQDICFVPDGNYTAVVEQLTGRTTPIGDFLDMDGNVLGKHKGFIRYTRGQHKGLGLSTPEPLYVLSKDAETYAIRLGPDSALWSRELTAKQLNWISMPELTAPIQVTAKTRYSHRESAAVVEPLGDGQVHVTFEEPQRAITAGQAVVFYDGDLVVGGGTISE